MSTCAVCDQPTKNKCSNCNQSFYCCAGHQKQHWKTHKVNCRPFKVEYSDQLGRYLVATRSIKPFEIILKEAPLICTPSQVTNPVCLGCLNGIEPSDYVECDKCGWPLCGVECKGKADHQAECQFTIERGSKVSVKEFTNPHPLYQCMGTVRCLLLAKSDPEKWQMFLKLESLEKQRRGSMQWKADLESIGKFIPRFFKTTEFNEDLIMKTIGILQINGHEVPVTDPPHVAVFSNASFLEHSCIPNLAKSFSREGNLILWAPKAIKKNTHLSICYSDAVWGTAERQQHLMHTKLFKCVCERCLDITECGTNYDAFKCTTTNCDGVILPSSLKEWNSAWRCSTCGAQADISFIKSILEKAGKDLQAMDKTVENCMKYIQHYEKWLTRRHYFICQAKIHLVQLIGTDPKELMVVPEDQLNKKLEYVKDLLELYENLAPCEVRMLGTFCFELHSAIAEHTRRVALQTTLSPKNMLEESLLYVEKCIDYLQRECDLFVEGHILKQAKINRDALRMVLVM
ncbi:SET domain-containing protein SmydA-8 [Bactrocera neohumeralis]|uniref:SET domain-containing protein SmydA-8 n=1 Tax=Bactrocera tryoni TaxID=59916 RepID=UPI001A96CFE9|nr:SET domain-containing protein SmydA-8 [Bactrocera tryoni]XP_050324601.1 SET domain-containing protein SmydA-8 [Bactrocera neohumeralis]